MIQNKKDNPIVILGALEAEIDEYVNHLDNPSQDVWQDFVFYRGKLKDREVVVARSGVGKVMAAMVVQRLIDIYDPQCIIFTGVAGGLNKKFEVGDIVVARDLVQYDLDARELGFPRGKVPYTDYMFFETDRKLRELALQAKVGHTVHEGRILTGDHFLTKSEIREYGFLIDEFKGDAVEMEGAAVGQVCVINKVPFLVIRTISDKADEEASVNFNKFLPVVAKNSFDMVRYLLENY